MALNTLFSNNSQNVTFSGANQLQKTAQLTSLATEISAAILRTIESDEEKFTSMVLASQTSHDSMDKLITECVDLSQVDVEFLKDVSEDDIDKMIRSQQSKRSRSKTKVMTLDTYRTMMIGAVSENLLRLVSDKPKSAVGGAHSGNIGYSEEQLQEYANDQEKLKKEIRNVQSKKSIMKSKASFTEEDERWQQLLSAEETLKSLRSSTTIITAVDERLDKIQAMLGEDKDISKLSNKDAKELLTKVQEMLCTNQVCQNESEEAVH